jgi:hypothetical protein
MSLIDFLHGLFTALLGYFSSVLDGIVSGALNGLLGIDA